jgi:hypothetical protein
VCTFLPADQCVVFNFLHFFSDLSFVAASVYEELENRPNGMLYLTQWYFMDWFLFFVLVVQIV